MACVHCALSELLAAADSAWLPERTGLDTGVSMDEQLQPARPPVSKPALPSRLPAAGVGVGVPRGVGVGVGVWLGVGVGVWLGVGVGVWLAVGVGVGPPPPGRPDRCGRTVFEKLLPFDA